VTWAPARSATSTIRPAEDAVDADQHLVARLDQIDDHRLHPRRARARDRHREPVLGPEDMPEESLRLVHERHELGVEVPQERHPERGQDSGVDVARPGPGERESKG